MMFFLVGKPHLRGGGVKLEKYHQVIGEGFFPTYDGCNQTDTPPMGIIQ